jgi:hypothetical protein
VPPGASSVTSAPVTTIPPVTAAPSAIRINTGGRRFVDSRGIVWAADYGSSGGRTVTRSTSILGTEDDKLYQQERIGSGFSYRIPAANGVYRLSLHFAESYYRRIGQRIINVAAENEPMLSNFQILAEAARFSPLIKSTYVAVIDGRLDLRFAAVKGSCTVSGIELVPLNTDDLLINSGGGLLIDSLDRLWLPDLGSLGGTIRSETRPLAGSADSPLYQSFRFGPYFAYRIPVKNGSYQVIVHTYEPYFDHAGDRTFGALLEGKVQIPYLDAFKAVGSNRSFSVSAATVVTDGLLEIDFVPLRDGLVPLISGIEIHRDR